MQPIAVLISDVHYSVQTLEVADKALRLAVSKANELEVPLIICGDLHDTKANLRGECVKAIMDTLETASLQPYILRGNHDQINEKSNEHSLEFLRNVAVVVTEPQLYFVELETGVFSLGYLIPYYHDPEELRAYLRTIPGRRRLIMHQGIEKSNAGHYIQDKSAITEQDVAGFRVISGHYHTRQTIQLPDGGVWDYVGNPYTLNYAEAKDPEKGFQILYRDGSLEFVPTNLREHVVLAFTIETLQEFEEDGGFIRAIKNNDLVLIKVSGPTDRLSAINKKRVADLLHLTQDFRLDLIPTDSRPDSIVATNKPQEEVLDSLIAAWQGADIDRVSRVQSLWKGL